MGGCLKAVWLEIFGPLFPGSPAETAPRDPLDRRGPPRTSVCTKNHVLHYTLSPGTPAKANCDGSTFFRNVLNALKVLGFGIEERKANKARRAGGHNFDIDQTSPVTEGRLATT